MKSDSTWKSKQNEMSSRNQHLTVLFQDESKSVQDEPVLECSRWWFQSKISIPYFLRFNEKRVYLKRETKSVPGIPISVPGRIEISPKRACECSRRFFRLKKRERKEKKIIPVWGACKCRRRRGDQNENRKRKTRSARSRSWADGSSYLSLDGGVAAGAVDGRPVEVDVAHVDRRGQ